MRQAAHELNRIPTEYHENGAPELPELPDEFNRFPRPNKRTKDRSRHRKVLLILAAAGIVMLGVLTPAVQTELPAQADENGPVAQATQDPSGTETEGPAETAAPGSTTAPEPTPQPELLPDCEAMYFFTHSVSNVIIVLSDPEHTTAVHVSVRDEQVNDSAYEHDLTDEEIAGGLWEETGIDLNDFYVKHAETYEALGTFIEPVLFVTVTYRTENGTEGAVVKTAEPTAEDYVYLEYFGDEYLENEWTYPGCFVASVYDTPIDPLIITTDPDHILQPGEIFISITADGETVPEENCYVKRLVDSYEYEGETYSNYSFILVMKRPDSFPEHGTAHITIREKLIHYDYIREREEDIDY